MTFIVNSVQNYTSLEANDLNLPLMCLLWGILYTRKTRLSNAILVTEASSVMMSPPSLINGPRTLETRHSLAIASHFSRMRN